ncbi:hypothetical protein L2755_18695 [Shewanella abyssi]|nr:hypothetical protein [Shewanella abyssi]
MGDLQEELHSPRGQIAVLHDNTGTINAWELSFQ